MKKSILKLFVSVTALISIFSMQTLCQSNQQYSLAKSKRDMVLWYKQPGVKWTEGLRIGNGYMGGMVFGRTRTKELRSMNLLSGQVAHMTITILKAPSMLPTISELIFAGKYKEAEKDGK